MEWFEIKRIILIIYVLLITVGIYAIGVGVTLNKKNENKLVVLAKQYRQKQQPENIKISSENTYQSFHEAKTAWDKANQAEASSALIAENKAKQEEIDKKAAESKEAAKQAKKATDLVKDEADKKALEAEPLEKQLLEEASLKENIE